MDEETQAVDETVTPSGDESLQTRIDIEYYADGAWRSAPAPRELVMRCRATLVYNGREIESQEMWGGLDPNVIADLVKRLNKITDAEYTLDVAYGSDRNR